MSFGSEASLLLWTCHRPVEFSSATGHRLCYTIIAFKKCLNRTRLASIGFFTDWKFAKPYRPHLFKLYWIRCGRTWYVRHCHHSLPECYKDNVESQWKNLKFDRRHPKTPEPMATKIGRGEYAPLSTPVQNCITNPLGDFVPAYAKLPMKCWLG